MSGKITERALHFLRVTSDTTVHPCPSRNRPLWVPPPCRPQVIWGRTLFTSRSWNVIKHYNGETSKGGSYKFLGTQKWMVDFMENLIKMDNVGLPPS